MTRLRGERCERARCLRQIFAGGECRKHHAATLRERVLQDKDPRFRHVLTAALAVAEAEEDREFDRAYQRLYHVFWRAAEGLAKRRAGRAA